MIGDFLFGGIPFWFFAILSGAFLGERLWKQRWLEASIIVLGMIAFGVVMGTLIGAFDKDVWSETITRVQTARCVLYAYVLLSAAIAGTFAYFKKEV